MYSIHVTDSQSVPGRTAPQNCSTEPQFISGAWITPSTQVRDLGVTIDSELSMIPHVNKVVSICCFHVRQLRLIRRSLDVSSIHALVRALIHSRLDYCNSLLAGSPDYLIKKLQSVLRSSARLILKIPSHSSVTDLMANNLHWLSFPQRITYKLAVLCFRCQQADAPEYLKRRFSSVSAVQRRSQLRSVSSGQLVVPYTHTKTVGIRGFHFSGPVTWNSLPTHTSGSMQYQCHSAHSKNTWKLLCSSTKCRFGRQYNNNFILKLFWNYWVYYRWLRTLMTFVHCMRICDVCINLRR